jgi:catechol 2,3-dioxygenase-like lactoylglutathione lyase family enzyme
MSDGPILNQINLVVSDVEATVAFYRRLGLNIPDTEEQVFQSHHREAQLPGDFGLEIDSIESTRSWDRGWRSGVGVIGFKLSSHDEVDRIYADLTSAGYAGQQEPYDAFWGARYAIVEDPNGNAVGLMSPVDPNLRKAPGFP